MNKLVLVAVGGLTTAAICLGAAAAVGGRNLGDAMDAMNFSIFDGKPRCEAITDASATSRDIPWDGSDHVGIAVPAQSTYTPGDSNNLHVTGNALMIAHLQVVDGNIELNCRPTHQQRVQYRNVRIALPGRQFRKFAIAGSGNLALEKLNQDTLKVSIAGSGSIKANGKADTIKISIAGSGDADFGQVVTRDAKVEIAGSGNTDIAATGKADIEIAGSGDVNLHANPSQLETHIAGSGRIHNVTNSGA
jgi:hypothetical protein